MEIPSDVVLVGTSASVVIVLLQSLNFLEAQRIPVYPIVGTSSIVTNDLL